MCSHLPVKGVFPTTVSDRGQTRYTPDTGKAMMEPSEQYAMEKMAVEHFEEIEAENAGSMARGRAPRLAPFMEEVILPKFEVLAR